VPKKKNQLTRRRGEPITLGYEEREDSALNHENVQEFYRLKWEKKRRQIKGGKKKNRGGEKIGLVLRTWLNAGSKRVEIKLRNARGRGAGGSGQNHASIERTEKSPCELG